MEELRQNNKCKDFIGVLYGFVHTGRKTEPFTRERLRLLHQKIYRLLAGLPRCQAKCSSLHKLKFNKWCETCSKWKKELSNVNRSRSVNWEKTESWKWPDSYENIVEVFLPGDWTKNNPAQLSDISTQCHIWQQCTEFHLNITIVKNVRAARNETCHSSSFEVTDTEKAKAFDALKDLIKDPDIANDINVKENLSKLDDIDKDDLFSSFDKSLIEGITAVYHEKQSSLERKISKICYHLEGIEEGTIYSNTVLDRLAWKISAKKSNIWKAATLLPLALVVVFLGWNYAIPNDVSFKGYNSPFLDGCTDENYSLPWMQDLPLLEYVRDTNTLVGREWLFEILDRKLLQDESSGRGIVSVAEFGYGKSAIVSHLLCARQGEKGRTLKEHIAAFHICKYDVSSTQTPERFIRRLVGFFAMRIPEYGNIVSMMSSSSILYDNEKCAKEQDACFDQAFRIPFKTMTSEYSTMIVVIDALDECFHLTKNENFILNLISTRLRYFPKWVKFLITSRDIMQLKSLKQLERLNLLANDSNNIEDIKKYIEIIYNEKSRYFYLDIKQKILESGEGNFLYIVHALQYVQSPDFNGKLPELPFLLEDIYELNFDRQFQGGNTYSIARLILEIICTSLTPQNRNDIYDILINSEAINLSYKDFEREFEKLSYFIKAEDGVILRHKAIHSWLVNSASSRYKVSLTKGHELISKHLLRTVKNKGTGDIIALVIHLSSSKSVTLRKTFHSFNMNKVMTFKEKEVLHNLISKTESEEALDLLLFHHSKVDITDENGVSPAFLAAAKGHLKQLKLLLRKGANCDFVVNPCRKCNTKLYLRDFKKDIEEIKTIFYSGYGLLHIAVQHRSTEIARYLIEETDISLNHENVIGQRPIDIACELGNIEILKIFMSRKSNIIDDKCLYFATRNSHLNIVKQILDSGFEPNCISNKIAKRELSKIMKPCNCDDSDDLDALIKPLDTWWIVFRETSLHYAIRSGYSRIAEYIAKKTKRLVECVDSYGFTPFLLAIKHGRYQLTNVMKERANKDNCSSSASFLSRQDITGSGTIIDEKREDSCEDGATFAHLIAKYNRVKMIDLFENDVSLKWNIADSSGNKAIHYAASHSSTDFIKFMSLKFGRTAFEEESKNKSTAYHSAAKSCSEASLRALTNSFSDNIIDFKDNCNRSVLHYALMCEAKSWSNFPKNDLTLRCQKYLLKLTNVSHVDCNEQNLLHYILRFGHENLLYYLQKNSPQQYKQMLHSKNRLKLNPVEYTLYYAPHDDKLFSSTVFKQFSNESINTQSGEIRRSLIPWEKCLINIQKLFTQEETKELLLKHFFAILFKSPFLSKTLLLNRVFANTSFIEAANIKVQIIRGMVWAKYFKRKHIFQQLLKIISDDNPTLLFSCGQPLNRSPLHYIAFSAPWTYDDTLFDVINNTFAVVRNIKDLKCSTIDGFNLLHYSIIGGFINLTNFLMKKKLSLVTKNVSVVDILYMTVFAKFKQYISSDKSVTYSLLDRFLSDFIRDRKSHLKANVFCTNHSNGLSLVHFFAINGMARTIETVKSLFGGEITLCRNVHNFTAMFFAALFGRTSVESSLPKENSYIFPERSAVEFLLLNIYNNFPQSRKQNPFRCITSRGMLTMHDRALIKNYQCLKGFYDMYFVTVNDFFIHNIVFAREGLHLTEKLMLQYIEIKMLFFASLKSAVISNCSRFTRCLSETIKILNELKLWSGISNGYLSWQSEYNFLKNIYTALNLPFDKSMISLLQAAINTDCSIYSLRHFWNTMKYLDRTLRTVVQNVQDITILVSLMDQKDYIKIQSMWIELNGLKPHFRKLESDFGFSLCHGCSFNLLKGAVKNIYRFRYLNSIKSTTTYKHIDSVRSRNGPIFLRKSEVTRLEKKWKFIYKMMHKTKERQKWLLANFKSERKGDCMSQPSNERERREKSGLYNIRIPLI